MTATAPGGVTPTLTLVIPTFNEERRLPPTIETLRSWLDSGAVAGLERVIISDDGSADGTPEVGRSAASADSRFVFLGGEPHRGKGATLRRGFAASTTDLVAFVDADLPVPLDSLRDMVAAVAAADMVVGNRTAPGSTFERPQPALRRLGGRAFVRATAVLGFRSTSDPQCGVKVLQRERLAATVERCTCDRFAFDIELVTAATHAGLTVVDCPVRWIHVDGSTVRPVRDAAATLYQLVALRRRRRRRGDV